MGKLFASKEQARRQILTLQTESGRKSFMIAMTIFGVATAGCLALTVVAPIILPIIKQMSGTGP